MAGLEVPDQGEVTTSNELVIEYLPQNPYFDENATVIEQVFKGTSPFMSVLRNYEKTLAELEAEPENTKLQEKLLKLSGQMDEVGAWQLESEAKTVLTQLGVKDFNKPIKELSGGQRKKIALAGALIRPCNLLILDEPTNHLDNDTIDYLESVLKTKKCGLVMVTHDRYFLDRITNRIVELNEGRLYRYEGNYETFLAQKAEREANEARLYEKNMSLYKKELEWMRKGVEARRTKQKARQERFYALEESLDSSTKQDLELGLSTSRLGKKIVILNNVSKSYEGRPVITDFTYTLLKGDRIGIIGNNGMGKSTLLNLIAGTTKPDSGTVERGDTVRIGYYTQESKELDSELRVIDYIKNKAEYIKAADGTMISASRMLERFLFPPTLQYAPIEKLSGGEKRRLYLLGVLMEDINVLLLDEPTNDLDIYTLQVLEQFIDEFNGPVITVSHDRYFLDRMAEKIFAYEGGGRIDNIPGSYSDYAARKEALGKEMMTLKKEKTETEKKAKVQAGGTKLKLSYNEQREYDQIEDVIADLEVKIEEIDTQIAANASHYSKLQELTTAKEALEEELMEKMERWEYLSELVEKINNDSK